MSYTKTTWINGVTKVNADNMNHIEDGVEEAIKRLDELDDTIDEKVTEKVDEKITTELLDEEIQKEIEKAVNKIDSISLNGEVLPIDENKNVDITVPTKLSDLTNDTNFVAFTCTAKTNYVMYKEEE